MDISEVRGKFEELAKLLEEHGYQFYLWGGDLLEGKTVVRRRQNFDNRLDMELFMNVVASVTMFGVPVPMLMTAIQIGQNFVEKVSRGEMQVEDKGGYLDVRDKKPVEDEDEDWPNEVTIYEN